MGYFDDEEEDDMNPWDAWGMDRPEADEDPDSDFDWGND